MWARNTDGRIMRKYQLLLNTAGDGLCAYLLGVHDSYFFQENSCVCKENIYNININLCMFVFIARILLSYKKMMIAQNYETTSLPKTS